MKRIFTLLVLVTALIGNAMAQQVMTEVHDFTGFANETNITWGTQTETNETWDRTVIQSIGNRNYWSWIDGKARFSLGNSNEWQIYDGGFQMRNSSNKSFYINRLDAGDIVKIEYREQGSQVLKMLSSNTSIASGTTLNATQEFTVNSAGGVHIECTQWAVIYKVTIKTQHLAEYEIEGQTYKFTSGGVLNDKRSAVPYITVSIGNEKDLAYVRCYGENNGELKFGHSSVVESWENITSAYYQDNNYYFENNNAVKNELMGTDHTVFKGRDFSDIEPEHGTFCYFYPETNGTLYVDFYGTAPMTGTGNDAFFIFDRTANAPASSVELTQDGFATFNNGQGVRVLKGHKYFMCTTPLDPAKRNVAHMLKYTFNPDFYLDPLYKVIEHGYEPQTSGEIAVANLAYSDNLTVSCTIKKVMGNIASATAEVKNGKLYFTNITYKEGSKVNKGGVVIVEVDCTDGKAAFVLTVPYSAEKLDGTGAEVKRWEFFANKLEIGQYSNSNSQLHQETDKDPAEWLKTYMNLHDNSEPIFKNVYDVEGDNADMIAETEGLIILAQSNKTGIYNENEIGGDRYVGFMPSSKLIIPKLKAGDRVRIHMGRYGQTDAHLTITNGKDVSFKNGVENGKPIVDDYVIGGSHIKNEKLEGVYNFVVDHDGDFEITFKEGALLKFYDIKIYKADECEQDNAVRVNGSDSAYEWLFTDQDATDATKRLTYNLHKRGLGEPIELLLVDNVRGNLSLTKDNFTHVGSDADHPDYYLSFYTDVKKGDFGSFRTVVGCETQDHKYVTDYASRNMAVGYRETQDYPYTWDFTDLYLPDYAGNAIQTDVIDPAETSPNENKGWETYSTGWALRNCPNNKWGIYFASGGQLYAGNKMFAETAGLGFKRSTNDAEKMHELNKTVRVVIGGLELNNANSEEFHKIVIPQVDNGAVIYVRATPNTSSTTFAKAMCSVDGTNGKAFDKQFAVGNDEVYIIKNTESKRDIELWMNSVTIKKIGVSLDKKTVNVKGYATESRARAIDHELTTFFSGKEIKAYAVSSPNYADRTLTLTNVAKEKNAHVLPANKGCVLYYTGESELNLYDGGFHLFVPDMHDGEKLFSGENLLVPNVETEGLQLGMFNGDNTNYVLTYKYQQLKPDGTPYGEVNDQGPEIFYRVSKNGIKLHKNSAYLQLPTNEVKPKDGNSHAKFTFVFADEIEEEEGAVTAIEEIVNALDSADEVWYNLNGQKLNGRPTKSGLYILNGHKVVVK